MKVLVARFSSESNEHSRSLMTFDKFIFGFGEDCINSMYTRDIFENAGIELIPSIAAIGHPHGPVTKDAYDFILARLLHDVEEHLHEIDGIFLFLHGASKVIGLEGGSAEHAFLREIRKLTGPYLPIALVMDPHGNLSSELVNNVNILRCYRESPHTDVKETYRFVAEKFVDLLYHRRNIKPAYVKVPIIVGGEKSESHEEPIRSINRLCDEIEESDRIMSASFHIGYLRHDGDKLGCSAVVVPNSEADQAYAQEMADKLCKFAFSKRHEFQFHGNVAEPDDAIEQAVAFKGSPVFITDSGDNVGSGADGFNTFILHQVLNLKDTNGKQFLFSGIVDKQAYQYLYHKNIGDHVSFTLGANLDEFCKSVQVEGTITGKGIADKLYEDHKDIGTAITVKFDHAPISVIVEYDAIQYLDIEQYAYSGLSIEDYDVIIAKQGYVSDDFKKYGKLCIMSLTQGPTYQRSENLVFKRIMRPMFPYDDFELE